MSDRDVAREGWEVASPPPDKPYTVHLKGPDGPVPVRTVPGVDPGWAYNPGKAAYGTRLTDQAKAAMEADGSWKNWKTITPGDWKSAGRPAELPEKTSSVALAPKADNSVAAERILYNILWGPEKILTGPDGAGVLVSAAMLAGHHPERSVYYPLLPELIEDPEEIWICLEEHEDTGRVELRKRYLKMLRTGGRREALYLVAQVAKGQLVAWTLVPLDKAGRINQQRKGKLLWHAK